MYFFGYQPMRPDKQGSRLVSIDQPGNECVKKIGDGVDGSKWMF